MENSIKEQQKQISDIHSEVVSLRTTLIGIDGKNGMRSQITALTDELSEIKKCFNELFQKMAEINSGAMRYDLLFCTKKELNETEEKILEKIESIRKDYEEEKKEREEFKESRKKHLENLQTSRWLLLASVLGIITSAIINYIK